MKRSALMAAMSTVMVFAGCAPAQDDDAAAPTAPPAAETTSSPVPVAAPPVPLDGLYVIEWTGSGTRNGVAVDDLRREKNGWAFRTACGDDGCVATGGGIPDPAKPETPLAAVRVADYAQGHWSMVWTVDTGPSCTGADGVTYSAPAWSIWDIAVDAKGALTPTVTLVGAGDCPFIEVHRPIMTKADDSLGGVPVPDPADQPARVASAAAGFTGAYTLTRTPRGRPGAEQVANHEVATHCLRAEPRCVTVSVNSEAPEDFSVLQFDGNGFGRRSAGVSEPCVSGGVGVAEIVETLKPGGTAAPVRTVSGERVATFSAGCRGTVTDDVEYLLAAQ
ncbi:hypothetical protein [Mycolicibacterium frederiksbergense]|uniref:Uncharacterized protein n=1 Tax=Mycolicibacterium frederiksbergense TaxID=117567 RepID=A0A6H0S1B5_9MYCO|nr:hypothetical protein [Mycolicibacterium frederiksbergense]QIV81362.1 hypothetical protein EXE63_11020 [Mycolicibacterium frederiksbergense]